VARCWGGACGGGSGIGGWLEMAVHGEVLAVEEGGWCQLLRGRLHDTVGLRMTQLGVVSKAQLLRWLEARRLDGNTWRRGAAEERNGTERGDGNSEREKVSLASHGAAAGARGGKGSAGDTVAHTWGGGDVGDWSGR
jgi:hypothetical protein